MPPRAPGSADQPAGESFVMHCLNSGVFHYRRSRSSAPQPNQARSAPKQSAADESKGAPPRQAAHARLERYLDQSSEISGKLYFEGPAEIDGQIDG
jgi:hypothetical protein